jgi:hypothetical protein
MEILFRAKRRVAKVPQEPSMRSRIVDQIEQSLTSARKELTKSVFDYDARAESLREKERKRRVIRKHVRDE